ncbi:hypothetical protein MKW92_010019 [Papaver armeniacum]|nr:hypothetical protein MKW92_010019 [Papaver armeniacum]
MDIQLPSILAILAFLFFIFMVVRNGEKSGSKTPPGPWKLPFIGNLHNMLGLVPHRSLRNLANKYGPIMHLQLGEVPVLVVSSPNVAKQIMKTHDLVFADRPEIYAAKVMLYDCTNVVFSRYGDYWREMRKIFIMQLLSAKHVPLFQPLRNEEVRNMITSISLHPGIPVNLSKRITSLFNMITSRAAFGDNCKVDEEVISMMRESLTLVGGLEDLFPSLKLLHRICGMKSKLLGLHQEVDKFLEGVIQEHRMSKMVKIDNALLGRDPEYWSNADAFEPERFDGNTVDYKGNHFEYIPFGAGRRMCPGMSFAMANVELTLAHLLYHFDWKLVGNLKTSEELDMTELFGVSVARKNDLILIPIPY